MRKVFIVAMLILVAGVFTLYAAQKQAPKGDLVLYAKKVSSAPADAASSQWNAARESTFVMVGNGSVKDKVIKLKARSVYTNDRIFFRFEWPDKDKSMNKKRWRYTGSKWIVLKGNEDRLGVVWEIHRVNKFATKGCAVFCHNQAKDSEDWYYAVDSPREKADLWHWKSVRSNPVGYTEDGYVTTNPTKKPEEGRKRDAGAAGFKAKSNRTKDKTKPAYMQDPSKAPSIPGSLLADEAVPISDYSIFKAGDEIPGYLLHRHWKGSFADVKTKGVWQNGKWVVMMSRKLKTGHDDDLQFNTRKQYPFGLAVFNNSGEENSYNDSPLKLVFK